MITLDGTASARAASGVRGVTQLIELDFASGLLRVSQWPVTFASGGYTWTGLGDVLSISPTGESEDTKADKLTLSLSLVNTAMLAAVIGPATEYRGRAVRIYTQFLDDTYQPAGAYALEWAGTMNKVGVPRAAATLEGEPTGSIELECVKSGMAAMRNDEGLRLTHEQQQQRFPGDNGLEYMNTLVRTPVVWLSKRFLQI